MNESFLHFVWQYRHFNVLKAVTTDGQKLLIDYPGMHNHDAGPDFLQAEITINGIKWFGSVEIHIRSSDWLKHHHQNDEKYNSVILHVVYENDVDISLPNGEKIPSLELKSLIDDRMFEKYEKLLSNPDVLACRNSLENIDSVYLNNQLASSLLERILKSQDKILKMLAECKYDWNEVIYRMLMESFGCRTNSVGFELLARNLPYKIVYQHRNSALQLDALFFGVGGFLNSEEQSDYYSQLCYEYDYLRYKYQLSEIPAYKWNLLRLRPQNFPAIRIAQFSNLMYVSKKPLKDLVLEQSFEELSDWIRVSAGDYWQHHYQFGKTTKSHRVALGPQAIDSVMINAIIPIRFSYAKYFGNDRKQEEALRLYEHIDYENNLRTRIFSETKFPSRHAGDSQAQIELLKEYCTAKRCLKCTIGEKIIREISNL